MTQIPEKAFIPEQIDRAAVEKASALLAGHFDHPPTAYVHAFGCQQNVSDAERIRGVLYSLGFGYAASPEVADLVLFHTCAVRESAEDRVYGHIGILKSIKQHRPGMLIAVGGCMTQRPEVAQKLRESFPYVDIVFGTGAIHRLPELLAERLAGGRRVFDSRSADQVVEGMPTQREPGSKAWLPIMQGCDNFCSYCIVPYVRGRERSRAAEEVEHEAQEILLQGYREITLLGQNVNSYGKGLSPAINFPALLRRLDLLEGTYRMRFMTSHPKDCTHDLIDALAQSKHFCRHIHLPVQCGSDRVLHDMNRKYTVEQYLSLIEYARKVIPGVTFSSDIIVGFPGETREDFEQTLHLVEAVRYNALFTFIYSRRSGTKAAELEDPVPAADKSKWFRELLLMQQTICGELNQAMIGTSQRILFDSHGKTGKGWLSGRTEGNVIVECEAPEAMLGRFADVTIVKAMNWAMVGTIGSGSLSRA